MQRSMTRYGLAIALALGPPGCGSASDSAVEGPDQDGGALEPDSDVEDAMAEDAGHPDADTPDTDTDATDALLSLEVVEAAPQEGEVVARNRPLRFRFSNAIVRTSLTVELDGEPVRVVSPDDMEFRFTPLPLFEPDTKITVRIVAGVTDVSGAVLEEDWTRSFWTNANTVEFDGDPAWTTQEADFILSGATDEPMALVQDHDDGQSALYDINPPVIVPDSTTAHLVERMFASMTHHGGIGLAAPQIGIARRLFVASIEGEPRAFSNPVLTDHAEDVDTYVEGCLSVPFTPTEVLRPTWVELAYDDLDGTAVPFERIENGTGIHARVWLHEFDHLNGILLLDRAGN